MYYREIIVRRVFFQYIGCAVRTAVVNAGDVETVVGFLSQHRVKTFLQILFDIVARNDYLKVIIGFQTAMRYDTAGIRIGRKASEHMRCRCLIGVGRV